MSCPDKPGAIDTGDRGAGNAESCMGKKFLSIRLAVRVVEQTNKHEYCNHLLHYNEFTEKMSGL
jgi:hypothetical protein